MKVSTLLARGVPTALAALASVAHAQPPAADLRLSAKTSAPAPPDAARARVSTPPAPRGDLRGDIASNARARPDNDREERSPHH
ncbi:hypothetical protein P9239_10255 [Caballeronia sp. LZ062]|uniref:hypothetical protein n=1 Tax=unclassified Caballeronia TaxID=2646786 RepID=UPI00285D6D57|nr:MULTISPECIES: hypothetical protein [unclassified Caballeronia]MDR5854744.1 hypothetical protein [Caballeronia sp. LZ050]MDR5870727.1 hypothetical protein [Caballeronia sp. LZ062]